MNTTTKFHVSPIGGLVQKFVKLQNCEGRTTRETNISMYRRGCSYPHPTPNLFVGLLRKVTINPHVSPHGMLTQTGDQLRIWRGG